MIHLFKVVRSKFQFAKKKIAANDDTIQSLIKFLDFILMVDLFNYESLIRFCLSYFPAVSSLYSAMKHWQIVAVFGVFPLDCGLGFELYESILKSDYLFDTNSMPVILRAENVCSFRMFQFSFDRYRILERIGF